MNMKPVEVGAIVSAYTGIALGDFQETHKYIEKIMERPVFTHEMGSAEFMDQVREKAKSDFVKLHEWCSGGSVL